MRKKLAVIGASYLQLPLIEKAISLGIETHVFAWEEGNLAEGVCDYFYPISITQKDAILEKCQAIGIDGITSIASDLAVPTVNFVAHHLNLIGNPLAATLKCTNKYAMRLALENNGMKVPKYQAVQEILEVNGDDWVFPVIVKPTDRSGSLGVTKVQTQERLKEAVSGALEASFTKECIIEDFIEGREFSVEYFSFRAQHYPLVITDKVTTGPPYFVEVEHHQPAIVSAEEQKAIFEAVNAALDTLDVQFGASHTEVFLTADGRVIIGEVGARMGGDFIGSTLTSLSTGFDILEACILVALGEEPIVEVVANKSYIGIHYYMPDRPWVKRVIEERRGYVVKSELFEKKSLLTRSSQDRLGYFIYQCDWRVNYGIDE